MPPPSPPNITSIIRDTSNKRGGGGGGGRGHFLSVLNAILTFIKETNNVLLGAQNPTEELEELVKYAIHTGNEQIRFHAKACDLL